MNVILHFGSGVRPEDACEQFNALIRFAQRYPCRIIVLCPTDSDSFSGMESKLFSQCYIGDLHREMCCCEALILRYKPMDARYLFNQVSIWLEGDLPTYYWFSEVPAKQIESYLDSVLKLGVRRCVFDSSVEPGEFDMPDRANGCRVNDLVEARLLPVRQVIGQFLNRYSIKCICEGLHAVRIRHSGSLSEGRSLLEWIRSCLSDCEQLEACLSQPPEFFIEEAESATIYSLEIEFAYSDDRYFIFRRSSGGVRSTLKANLKGNDEITYASIQPVTMEQALAEAFFCK